MSRNDQLYRAYLDEMQALNEFVMNYHTEHKFSGLKSELSSEDPDVNRLLESIAFFSARIHDSVVKNLQSYRYRLFQQLFPFLLTPIPSSGIISAVTSGLLTDPVTIDRGTDFILQTREGKEFFWQSLRDSTIYPFYIKSVDNIPAERVGTSLYVTFACRHTIHGSPNPLSLLIDYISDIKSSFRLLTFFKDNLTSARVYIGSNANLDDRHELDWIDLDLPLYGTQGLGLTIDQNDFLHPIETERLFFQDPRIELFIHLSFPKIEAPIPGFTIEFNFCDSWPKGLAANKDILVPNSIPIINYRQIAATPVLVDGTITSFPILSGHEDSGFELCKTLGVYQLRKDGMTPLIPGVVSRSSPCYEIESRTIERRGRFFSNLIIHYPQSFIEPVQVFVDAIWHQPSFKDHRENPAEIRTYSYNISGVRWEWSYLPSEKQPLPDAARNSDMLLEILHISHKQYYGTEDIRSIMLLLGTIADGPYRSVFAAFSSSRYELRTIDNASLTPGHIIYFLTFDWEYVDRNDQFFKLFMRHFETVLNLWSDGREVKLSLDI